MTPMQFLMILSSLLFTLLHTSYDNYPIISKENGYIENTINSISPKTNFELFYFLLYPSNDISKYYFSPFLTTEELVNVYFVFKFLDLNLEFKKILPEQPTPNEIGSVLVFGSNSKSNFRHVSFRASTGNAHILTPSKKLLPLVDVLSDENANFTLSYVYEEEVFFRVVLKNITTQELIPFAQGTHGILETDFEYILRSPQSLFSELTNFQKVYFKMFHFYTKSVGWVNFLHDYIGGKAEESVERYENLPNWPNSLICRSWLFGFLFFIFIIQFILHLSPFLIVLIPILDFNLIPILGFNSFWIICTFQFIFHLFYLKLICPSIFLNPLGCVEYFDISISRRREMYLQWHIFSQCIETRESGRKWALLYFSRSQSHPYTIKTFGKDIFYIFLNTFFCGVIVSVIGFWLDVLFSLSF